MFVDGVYILAVLSLVLVVSEWLVHRTWLRHIGSALLVIVITAVLANLGVLPTGTSEEVPVYDGIFGYIAPLSILWLLLGVNLRDILKAGLPIISIFLIGSLGTVLGVLAGMWVIDGAESIGSTYHALGGMFVGTYTGGSVNFNALALNYDIMREGVLYSGAVAVDNIMTATWMVATLSLPRLLMWMWPRRTRGTGATEKRVVLTGIDEDTETLHPIDLGLILFIGLISVWGSDVLAVLFSEQGLVVPSVVILTIIALILAQIPVISRLKGARLLGMYSVYLFLAVIGAYCDLAALREIGQLGPTLLLFTVVIVAVHGVITFGMGRLFKIDLDVIAVASQANVGGATSALALARSLGRKDLVLPAVLVGSLGLAIGTFLGFWTAEYLLP